MANQRASRVWLLGSPDENRPYFISLFSARAELQQKGIQPPEAVWCTELISARENRQPRTVEMYAWRAAEVMALNRFRLSTQEEIEAERKAMRERSNYCAAVEASNRKQSTLNMSMAMAQALRELGPDVAKGKSK